MGLQVIPIFFENFVVTSRNDSPLGWMEFLPDLFERVSVDSALYGAVHAAAYANIAQKYDRLDLQYEAVNYYSKALKLVNNAMAQDSTATSNATIIAVILLGVYEVCTG